MWFSLKLGFRGFFGDFTLKLGFQNWDFSQNIWISAIRGHLKSPLKRPEIPKNAQKPDLCQTPVHVLYLENHMGRAKLLERNEEKSLRLFRHGKKI